HTRWPRDWSSDVCSSDLMGIIERSRQINADLKDISPIDLTGGINAANDGGQALAVNVLFGDPAIIARLSGAVHLEKMRVPERQRSEEHTSELQSRGHLVC